jgi:hypothetical protein
MVTCPTCGTRSPDGSFECSACGGRLDTAAEGPLARDGATDHAGDAPLREPPPRPLVRVSAAGSANRAAEGQAARPNRMRQTMIGVAPAPNAPMSPGGAPARANVALHARRTMIGVAPAPNAAPGSPAASAPSVPAEDEPSPETVESADEAGRRGASDGDGPSLEAPTAPAAPGVPARAAPAHRATMTAGSPPLPADPARPLAPPFGATAPSPLFWTADQGPARPFEPAGTGPAAGDPGPTEGPEETLQSAVTPPMATLAQSAPTTTLGSATDVSPPTPKAPSSQAPTLVSANTSGLRPRRARSRGVLFALIATLGLGLAGGAGALWLNGREPVKASVAVDSSGAEVLALDCAACADGATVRLGAASGTFANHHATLTLDRALGVGENRLEVTLEHPNGKSEQLALHVPVDFRLDPDATGLTGSPPTLRVNVVATGGASVVVNGEPVPIDPEGHGSVTIDVSAELTGAAPAVTSIDKVIPYTVSLRRADPANGELTVRMNAAALIVDAPGDTVVLEGPNFWLSGRSMPGTTISVAGRTIPVDSAGVFHQLMSVSAVGETTIFVRADLPEHAPRLVPLRVRRVPSLRAEGERLDREVTHSNSELLEKLHAHRSQAVGFNARVLSVQPEGRATRLLVDVVEGCPSPPCLARVLHGANVTPPLGATWRVYGRSDRLVPGPTAGAQIPEVRADFMLPSGTR